jgi:putative tricarboxylic transport membrane protein
VRKGILVSGAIFLALDIIYLFQAFHYQMGSLAQPGSALYPVFAGAVLMVGAIGMLVSTLLKPPAGATDWPRGVERVRVLSIIAVSLFYAFALEFLGYALCGAIAFLVCLQVMGMRSWWLKVGLTVVVTALSFILFDRLFSVPLPRGILDFL